MTQQEFEAQYVNTIVCGDCLDVMKDWPDGCVDLVLTDPPYGIDYNNTRLNRPSGNAFEDIQGDDKPMDFSFLLKRPELKIIFGANNFVEQLPFSGRWLVWDKRVNPKADYVLGSPVELAWINKKQGYLKIYRVEHYGFVNDDRLESKERLHPTQKPVRLIEYILNDFSKPNTLILDPFCGSGTTCVAAKKLGRRFIGIDISEDYCEIARQRLESVDTGVPVKEARKGQGALFAQP